MFALLLFDHIDVYPKNMPFAPISLTLPAPATFNAAGTGKYALSTVTFGQPNNLLLVTGAKRNAKTGITSCTMSRQIQKDVTVGTAVVRRLMSLQLVLNVADGFTTGEIDNALRQLDEFVTVANLERVLQGES